ncbi:ABC transporter ATP-binding protein [Gemmatimonadota bacterium]
MALGAGFFFVLLSSILGLAGPRIFGWAIDAISVTDDRHELLPYIVLLLAVEGAAAIFIYYQRILLLGTSRKIDFDLRNDFFRHLLVLPFSFYNRQKTGDIMARATNDLEAVRMFIGPGLWNGVELMIILVIALPIMFTISPRLTLYSLLPMAITPLIVMRISPLLHNRFTAVQEQFASLSSHVQENLNGIRVLKSYTREKSVLGRFRGLNSDYVDRNMDLVRVYGSFFPLLMAIAGLGLGLVIWLGGREVIKGNITLGDMVAFTQYHALLTWPMIALGWVINLFERGTASLERVNEIIDAEPEIRDEEGVLIDAQITRGEIEFRNLSFAYDETGDTILSDLSLRIPGGMTVGITGPTGSGKSTLLNLIPRLFQPERGMLFIDGFDVRDIPLETLRRSIGMVPQESFLFSESIEENISFGTEQLDREASISAAITSQLHEEILEFPDGYRQTVGERGVTLSGGQKQRLALSRAIIRDPRILILDDAFSSVDTNTEEAILEGLRDTLAERTSLIVSHRVSTLRDADMVIYIENETITEMGTHQEMIDRGGRYADMVNRQALIEELESLE